MNSTLQSRLQLCLLGALALAGCGGGGNSPPAAPDALSYPSSFELAVKGVDLAPLAATVRGGAVSSWSVTPALPAGLTLDAQSGSISGAATELAVPSTYVVRASNAAGFSEASIEIGVVAPLHLVAVANAADSSLSTYRLDPSSGLLAPTGITAPTVVETGARCLVAHPSGRYLYLVQRDSSTIRIFDVDSVSGRLLERGALACAGLNPNELLLSPDGQRLYAIAQTDVHVETFTVGADGSLSSLGSLTLDDGASPVDGAWDAELSADGHFMWLSNVTAKSIQTLTMDPITGLPTPAGLPHVSAFAPFWLVGSRDGRFLYTNCRTNSRLQVFAVDAQTGVLTLVENEITAAQPSRVVLSHSGRFLYATIASDDTIRTFAIDPQTGALTQVAATPAGDRPECLSFDFTGRQLYVTVGQGAEVEIFRVEPTTGALLREDSLRTRASPLSIATVPGETPLEPRAVYAYVAMAQSSAPAVFQLDAKNGALEPVSAPNPSASQPQSLVLHPSARWLLSARASDNQVAVLAIDVQTGLPSAAESLSPVGNEPIALAFEPSGQRLLVLHRSQGEVRSFAFDEDSGVLVHVGSLPVSNGSRSIAVDPSGRFAYIANPLTNEVLTVGIDLDTGALTQSLTPKSLDGQPTAIAVTPNGRYLLATAASKGRIALYGISAADGALSLINSRLAGTNTVAIASDPIGRFIYACNRDTNGVGDVAVFRVEPNALLSGFLTRIGEVTAGNQPVAVAMHPSGSHLYVANEGSNSLSRLTVDRGTGMLQMAQTNVLASSPQSIILNLRLVP